MTEKPTSLITYPDVAKELSLPSVEAARKWLARNYPKKLCYRLGRTTYVKREELIAFVCEHGGVGGPSIADVVVKSKRAEQKRRARAIAEKARRKT